MTMAVYFGSLEGTRRSAFWALAAIGAAIRPRPSARAVRSGAKRCVAAAIKELRGTESLDDRHVVREEANMGSSVLRQGKQALSETVTAVAEPGQSRNCDIIVHCTISR